MVRGGNGDGCYLRRRGPKAGPGPPGARVQQLHLVGFTTDLEGLIFSARKGAKSGGYFVTLDDRLRATIEDALRLRNGEGADDDFVAPDGSTTARPRRPRPQSVLSPREIQARLRSGSSIAEVADEAGVDEEWVDRFAVPILAEQAQVVARARRLVFVKPRLGESGLPLGEAVRWNLADKGVRFLDDEFEAAWGAYNLQGTSWVVRFQYVSRQKRHSAEWEVDLREDELLARNRSASDLAYIDPARRRRRPPVLEPSPRETPASAGRATSRPEAVAAIEPASAPGPTAVSPPRAASAGPVRQTVTRRPAKPAAPAKKAVTSKATKATKKAAKSTKALKAAKKATKARKAAPAKRGAGPKRARTTKKAAKKPGPEHRAAAATSATPTEPAALDIAVRRSHLARPPSPMKSANRAPAHAIEPYRPQPRPAPTLDREGFRVIEQTGDDGRMRLPPPRPVVQERRRPPEREPAPEPEPDAFVEAEMEVEHEPAPAETPSRPPAPTPEQRLARRLAAREAPRRRPPADNGDDQMWHGPGSGEPAPSVRIRADMAAAADLRPPPDDGPQPPRRRRERPLRAQ